MICENCGAEYPDQEARCTFCQSENPLMTEKRKKDVLKSIDREAMARYQDIHKQKVGKIYLCLMSILVGVSVLLMMAFFVAAEQGKLSARREYEQWQENVAYMDQLIADGEVQAFFEYFRSISGGYRSEYAKYYQLYRVGHDCLTNVEEYYEDYQEKLESNETWITEENRKELMVQYMTWMLEYAADGLRELQENINDRAVLGNEKQLQSWQEWLYALLGEKCGLTLEEIEQLRDCNEEETVIQQFAEQITEKDLMNR